MNISEHEYLLPIILGNDKNAVSAARKTYKRCGVRAHLFAPSFPFWQRAFFKCHTVSPMRNEFLLESLTSFLGSIEEYYCPVIIICDDRAQNFVEQNSAVVESACMAIRYEDFFENESKGKEQ